MPSITAQSNQLVKASRAEDDLAACFGNLKLSDNTRSSPPTPLPHGTTTTSTNAAHTNGRDVAQINSSVSTFKSDLDIQRILQTHNDQLQKFREKISDFEVLVKDSNLCKKTRDLLARDVVHLKLEIYDLKVAIKAKAQQLQQMESERDTEGKMLRLQISKLETQLEAVEVLEQSKKTLALELASFKGRARKAQRLLNANEAESIRFKAEQESLVNELNDQVIDLQQMIMDKEAIIECKIREGRDAAELQMKIASLEAKVQEKESQSRNQDGQSTEASTNAFLDRVSVSQLQSLLKSAEARYKASEQRVQDLLQAQASTADGIAAINSSVADFRSETAKLEGRIRADKADCAAKEDRLRLLSAEVDWANEAIRMLQEFIGSHFDSCNSIPPTFLVAGRELPPLVPRHTDSAPSPITANVASRTSSASGLD